MTAMTTSGSGGEAPGVSWLGRPASPGGALPTWIAPPPVDCVVQPSPPPSPTPRELASRVEGENREGADAIDSPPMPRQEAAELRPLEAELEASLRELEGLRHELAALREELAARTSALAALKSDILRTAEPQVVALALAVAERIVRRSLEQDSEVVAEWVREGIAALAASSTIVVGVSPELAARLAPEAWVQSGARIEVDTALPRWGCVVRCDTSRIDVGLRARINAIAATLGLPDEEDDS
jgi:hypothetical protein